MNKTRKRVAAVLLALCMVLGMLPLAAGAADATLTLGDYVVTYTAGGSSVA